MDLLPTNKVMLVHLIKRDKVNRARVSILYRLIWTAVVLLPKLTCPFCRCFSSHYIFCTHIYNYTCLSHVISILLFQGGFAKCYELTDMDTKQIYAGKIVAKALLTKPHQRDKVKKSAFVTCAKNFLFEE